MSDELKPCPFCGSEAGLSKGGRALCSNEGCIACELFAPVECWNRRAQSAEAEGVGIKKFEFEIGEGGPVTEPLVRYKDHLAALSAVTAERDKIKADRKACWEEFKALVKSSCEKESYLQVEIDQLRAEVEALRVLLIDARELIEHGDFREGHCMCGSSVDGHTFGDGHTPCDAGEYYAGQVRERIDAAMAAKDSES